MRAEPPRKYWKALNYVILWYVPWNWKRTCQLNRLPRVWGYRIGSHSPRISKACTSIETHTTFPISIEHTLRSNVMCKRRKDINSFVILSQAVRTEHWEHILLTFSLGNRTHVCCCFQSNAHAHKHALVQTCVFSTISLGHIHIVWTTTDHIT